MENASKAIEIAISAILFIVAAILAIMLYSNMQEIIDMGMYINNIDTVAIYSDETVPTNIRVNKSELYYIVENLLQKKSDVNEGSQYYNIVNANIAISFNNKIYLMNDSLLNDIISSNNESFEIKYTYQFIDDIRSDINKHELIRVIINSVS